MSLQSFGIATTESPAIRDEFTGLGQDGKQPQTAVSCRQASRRNGCPRENFAEDSSDLF